MRLTQCDSGAAPLPRTGLCTQVMFVSGVSLLIGLNNAGKFFFGANLKSSAMFFGGIFIVLIGYSIIGMLVESVGLFYLFRCVRMACLVGVVRACAVLVWGGVKSSGSVCVVCTDLCVGARGWGEGDAATPCAFAAAGCPN